MGEVDPIELKHVYRAIILILTITSILITNLASLSSYTYLIPIVLVSIALVNELYIISQEKKARLTDKKIDSVQIETELLKEDVRAGIDEVIEKVEVKEKLNKTRKLVTKLIDKGYVTERIVYSLVKPREFYFIVTYNDPPSDELKEFYPNDGRQLILDIIESFGFVKLGAFLNFYIIIPETIKKEFRDINKIKKLIMKKFNETEKRITEKIKKENMDIIRKGKNEEKGYRINYSFIICSAKLKDMSLEFHPFNAFSDKFKEYLNGAVDLKELKKETEIDRHKIKNFILRASNDFLLDGIKEEDRKKIIAFESNMNRDLGINKFTDYADVPTDKLADQLFLSVHNRKKANQYAVEIKENCRAYTNLFHELDIDF